MLDCPGFRVKYGGVAAKTFLSCPGGADTPPDPTVLPVTVAALVLDQDPAILLIYRIYVYLEVEKSYKCVSLGDLLSM